MYGGPPPPPPPYHYYGAPPPAAPYGERASETSRAPTEHTLLSMHLTARHLFQRPVPARDGAAAVRSSAAAAAAATRL